MKKVIKEMSPRSNTLVWNYTKKAIKLMSSASKDHNAYFVVIPITPWESKNFPILKNFTDKHSDILFIDKASTINKSRKRLFLKGDGHFNEEGAKEMAKIIVNFLRKDAKGNKSLNRDLLLNPFSGYLKESENIPPYNSMKMLLADNHTN